MNTANYLAIMAAVIIGLVIHAIMYAPQPAIMAEMFPDPHAVFRCVPRVSGDVDRGGVTGARDRYLAAR